MLTSTSHNLFVPVTFFLSEVHFQRLVFFLNLVGSHGPFSCVHLHVAKVAFSGISRNPKPNAPGNWGRSKDGDPCRCSLNLGKVAKVQQVLTKTMCISCWSNTPRMRDIEYQNIFMDSAHVVLVTMQVSRLLYKIEGVFDVCLKVVVWTGTTKYIAQLHTITNEQLHSFEHETTSKVP